MTKQQEMAKGMKGIILERQPSLAQSYGNARDSNLFIGATVRMLIEYLDSQGVVIKVERELPELKELLGEAPLPEKMAYLSAVKDYQDKVKEAGYVAVEPLIEEK